MRSRLGSRCDDINCTMAGVALRWHLIYVGYGRPPCVAVLMLETDPPSLCLPLLTQAAPLFRRRSLLPNVPLSQMDELCEQFCKVPLDEFYVHCGHHKRTSDCKICSDCGHGHVKSNCKICSNCGHGKLARNCIDCSGDCGHGHVKSDCKICSNCGHGHVKSNCKICSDCGHGHLKSDCKICSNCGHGNVKRDCVVCNGCVHKRLPSNCPKCNPCLHGNVVGDCNRRRCLNCCRLTEVIGRRIVVVYEERKKKVEYAGEVVSAVIGELEVRFDGDDTLCPVYVGSNQKPDKGLEDDEYWWEAKKASKPPQGKGKRPAAAVPLSQVSEGAASGAKRRQR